MTNVLVPRSATRATIRQSHDLSPSGWHAASEQTEVVRDELHWAKVFVSGGGGIRVRAISASGNGHADTRRSFDDDVRAQVSSLWAEDWDSDDDAIYDTW